MTVINQVQQTLAGLKSAQASFEGFALQTDNQQAKQMYQQAAQQTQQIVDQVNSRVQQIEQEEPQYNPNQQQQQKQ
jgi:16S rRNA C1402 (ribose-2'-O) methylase RsmI